ncbi:hypothetical protein BATDEDRAFT_92135 [Batrachochytrium dendrobatidis JAM81]|uniref:BSD domain-containing protein n=1 Tax=Batrachochytrium dendrobatidis (strain JAM81 / FGSC 10211) TaxID=684364 RepID=F4PCM7_BATDJ|nr:uncharacterized protein BATDEDRAFT_92135 [Batrachochytrium dendrobatidis JAM81]EGF76973.1 hypothetical protein BATDEDRAFT_92135 [Batrachochytrium dendrobatidis JAM81]|eukprot:XP_006682526.1 hypothetical protein BATDEDRAFT_92135 [Batrachochytrium dendrobatidis JAM81]
MPKRSRQLDTPAESHENDKQTFSISKSCKTNSDFDFFDLGKKSVSRTRPTALENVDSTAEQRKRAILLDLDNDSEDGDILQPSNLIESTSSPGRIKDAKDSSASSLSKSQQIRDVSLTPPPMDLSAESQASLDEIRRNLWSFQQSLGREVDVDVDEDDRFEEPFVHVSHIVGAGSSATTHSSNKVAEQPDFNITVKIEHHVWPHADTPSLFKPFKIKVSKNHRVQQLLNVIAHRSGISELDLVLSHHNVKLFPLSYISESGVHDGDTLVSYTSHQFTQMLNDSPKRSILNRLSVDSPEKSKEDQVLGEHTFVIQIRQATGITKVRVGQKTTFFQISEKLDMPDIQFEFDGERLDKSSSIEEIEFVSSFGSKLVTTLSEANASLDAQRDEYLKARKEKDGGDFKETPADALQLSPLPMPLLSNTLLGASKGNGVESALDGQNKSVTTLWTASADPNSLHSQSRDVDNEGQRSSDKKGIVDPSESTNDTGAAAPSGFFGWNRWSNATATSLVSTVSAHPSPTITPSWTNVPNADSLQKDIFLLSKEKRNFLTPLPEGTDFVFKMDVFYEDAMWMLKEDPDLQKMRFDLVPKVINDNDFWKNYFYRVNMLKQQAILANPQFVSNVDSSEFQPSVDVKNPVVENLPVETTASHSDHLETGDPIMSGTAPLDIEQLISSTLEPVQKTNPELVAKQETDYDMGSVADTIADDEGDLIEPDYGSDWEKELQAELGL